MIIPISTTTLEKRVHFIQERSLARLGSMRASRLWMIIAVPLPVLDHGEIVLINERPLIRLGLGWTRGLGVVGTIPTAMTNEVFFVNERPLAPGLGMIITVTTAMAKELVVVLFRIASVSWHIEGGLKSTYDEGSFAGLRPMWSSRLGVIMAVAATSSADVKQLVVEARPDFLNSIVLGACVRNRQGVGEIVRAYNKFGASLKKSIVDV